MQAQAGHALAACNAWRIPEWQRPASTTRFQPTRAGATRNVGDEDDGSYLPVDPPAFADARSLAPRIERGKHIPLRFVDVARAQAQPRAAHDVAREGERQRIANVRREAQAFADLVLGLELEFAAV